MYSTFGEVYEINCARYGREADLPITHFKERLNQALTSQLSNDAIVELRLHTYNEITNSFVSENVFSQYMYKTLPTSNHLWTFKKQFAVQLALSGFMSYMLQIGGRSPNKILFAKNTGKVFQNDFHPGECFKFIQCVELRLECYNLQVDSRKILVFNTDQLLKSCLTFQCRSRSTGGNFN